MCGIVGVLATTPVEGQLVARMRDQLTHRGPDHAGLWLSADARTCLGHRRLAIVDLAGGLQPALTPDRSVALVFNGEIFNYRDLRRELTDRGETFATNSEIEVLLKLYQREGLAMASRLNGQFAIAIYGGYFGAGMGVLMVALYLLVADIGALGASGMRMYSAVVINAIAVVLFAARGALDYSIGLPMLLTTSAGAYAGAKLIQMLDEARSKAVTRYASEPAPVAVFERRRAEQAAAAEAL